MLSWLKIIITNSVWVVQSFMLLSDCAHAPGADNEIIIACTVGTVTLLIENTRSLPYFPSEGSQGSVTLQSCHCKTEPEPQPVAHKDLYSCYVTTAA